MFAATATFSIAKTAAGHFGQNVDHDGKHIAVTDVATRRAGTAISWVRGIPGTQAKQTHDQLTIRLCYQWPARAILGVEGPALGCRGTWWDTPASGLAVHGSIPPLYARFSNQNCPQRSQPWSACHERRHDET